MNEHWKNFYKKPLTLKESSFARSVLPYFRGGQLIDLGCGNYRDTNYFVFNKIDADGIDAVYGQSVEDYIKENKSPRYVYARFFWHSIERDLQLRILGWTREYLFIEARSKEDEGRVKAYPKHERNYVDILQLANDLEDAGFKILRMEQGTGLSKYKNEDPYLVRIYAKKLFTRKLSTRKIKS